MGTSGWNVFATEVQRLEVAGVMRDGVLHHGARKAVQLLIFLLLSSVTKQSLVAVVE